MLTPGTPAEEATLTAGKGDVDAVGCSFDELAGLRGAGAHVHLLDAAVYRTCTEETGLPGLLRLPTAPLPPAAPGHSPQSTKRRGSARTLVAAPSARSRASDDSTMAAAAAGTAAAAPPRRHMSAAAPPAGQLGRPRPRGRAGAGAALAGGGIPPLQSRGRAARSASGKGRRRHHREALGAGWDRTTREK